MTPYALLLSLTGLSQREAGEFHTARIDTIKSWVSGRRSAPPGALAELRALIAAQTRAAAEALAIVRDGKPDEIELGYPANDHEARSLGWPCVGAWAAMAARVIAETDARASLVPRGSTPATAKAADVHEGRG